VTVDVLRLARELSQRGEPFALATVVWRRGPSSGRQGAKAIISTDGGVSGWLGGACAEPAVVREALRALAEGSPRLMFVGPAEELEAREGVVTVPIACQSEGALEIYVEPVLPAPELVAVGRSPAVAALAAIGRALGWRTVVIDEGAAAADHPDADRVLTSVDELERELTERSLVVVATQGRYDEAALEHALRARPAYVGLVASRRRAEFVLGYLRERGVPDEALRAVHAPAGLDLGELANEEIAVAIVAEIVRLRAAGEIPAGVGSVAPSEQAIDPVCGMAVDPATSPHSLEHEGRTHWFCSASCLEGFRDEPARYAASEAGAGGG
jgi:xanthine dehydrogenase accessory factor